VTPLLSPPPSYRHGTVIRVAPATAAKVATPTITPDGGSFVSTQSVSLACATSGATIRYTTDGTTPSSTSSAYDAPFALTSAATVKARGFTAGMTESDVASAEFIITSPDTVATPTIEPNGGASSGARKP
jgi:chitinase